MESKLIPVFFETRVGCWHRNCSLSNVPYLQKAWKRDSRVRWSGVFGGQRPQLRKVFRCLRRRQNFSWKHVTLFLPAACCGATHRRLQCGVGCRRCRGRVSSCLHHAAPSSSPTCTKAGAGERYFFMSEKQ